MAFSAWRTWVTGEVVTAAHMNQEVRDNGEALFLDGATVDAWTPTLQATTTNPSPTSSEGRQYQVGALMFVYARFVFGTAGGGTGIYFVALPTPAVGLTASGDTAGGQAIGSCHMRDASGPFSRTASVQLAVTNTVRFVIADGGFVENDQPFAWAFNGAGDVLTFHAVYPVA